MGILACLLLWLRNVSRKRLKQASSCLQAKRADHTKGKLILLTQHNSLASSHLTTGFSVPICYLQPGKSVLRQCRTLSLSSSSLLLPMGVKISICKVTSYGLNAKFRGWDFSLQRYIQRLRPTELVYTQSSNFLLQ
jgi:hypothetical protein